MAGIKDVAKRAGVSISTVSYALSGKRAIAPETQQRIKRIADELGYVPRGERSSALHRNSARGGALTHVLAISAPVHSSTDLANYAVFFFALATTAKKFGYDVMLLMDEQADREIERVARAGMVDGILMLDVEYEDPRAEIAADLPIPVVAVGYPENHESVYAVDIDFATMGTSAVDTAHDLGHSHLLLTGAIRPGLQTNSNYLKRFVKAVQQRCGELDIALSTRLTSGVGIDDAVMVADSALAIDPDITAIICAATAPLASSLTAALAQRDIRVPEDISMIVAMNGGGMSQLRRPFDEMPMNPNVVCRRAVEIMVDVLEGRRSDVGYVDLLPHEYHVHGTMIADRR